MLSIKTRFAAKLFALVLSAGLWAPPALAGITQIVGTGVGGAISNVGFGNASQAMTTTAAVPPGSLAICIVETFDTSPTLGCSDAVGNTWQAAPNGAFRANAGTQIWYSYTKNNIPNGSTITATNSIGTNGTEAQVLAFAGTHITPYDVSPVGTTGSGTSVTVGPSPTLTCPGTVTGCEVCVSGTIWNSAGTITRDGTWTATTSPGPGASNANGFKIVSATTALSYTGSTSASAAFAGAMACFKAVPPKMLMNSVP